MSDTLTFRGGKLPACQAVGLRRASWKLAAALRPAFFWAVTLGGLAPAADIRSGAGIDQKPGAQVPLDLEFQNEAGKTVRLKEVLEGRPVILNLAYFKCPMLCGVVMDGLIRSLQDLSFDIGDQFTVITLSFDPREGPEQAAAAKRTAIRRYGRPDADPHWHFLTGRRPEIDQLADSVGFRYQFDPKSGQYAHAAGLIVLTPEGRVSRYLLGAEFPPRDLRLGLIESSHGKIGSVSDQILLLCYQYDPASGKYGLLIRNVLRLAGLTTVMMLGGLVGILLWRERTRQRGAEARAAGEDSRHDRLTIPEA